MTVTIHQPEFLPWLGFFDRIAQADTFVFLDDVGYEKNGFVNRNKIKTKDGWRYITVPVQGRSPNKIINQVSIDHQQNWGQKHLAALQENYKNAPYFNNYYSFFQETLNKPWEKIADLDMYLIEQVITLLGIKTIIKKTSDMVIEGTQTERLVNICKALGVDTYLSGPGGKNYMDVELFKKENINVVFQEFTHPEYRQQFAGQGFLAGMSVVDLLFNHGPESLEIIKNGKIEILK